MAGGQRVDPATQNRPKISRDALRRAQIERGRQIQKSRELQQKREQEALRAAKGGGEAARVSSGQDRQNHRHRPSPVRRPGLRPVPAQAQAGAAAAAARPGHPQEAAVQAEQGKRRSRRFYDYSLLFCIIFLTVFGLIMIYSASSYTAQLEHNGNAAFYMERQALFAGIGLVGMIVISKINYHFWFRFYMVGYVMSYVLMIAVMLVGREANGKKRWLGVGPLSFQPTEFVKIALILFLAAVIVSLGNRINKLKNIGLVALYAIPLAALIAANNLSSGIIVAGITFVMLFVACKIKWPFFGFAGLGIAGLVAAYPVGTALWQMGILQTYQYNRILAWVSPEADPENKGFQVLQGLYAIGSGGFVGQGLGESIQKLGFLPESQNDMIFAIICEELGLFGAVSIILIFLFVIYRCMVIANNAPDFSGALLVVGVMGHIAIQVILNIAVVTNTIPNTGITLPFISYGGSAIVFLMAEMGLVLSVSNQIKLEK